MYTLPVGIRASSVLRTLVVLTFLVMIFIVYAYYPEVVYSQRKFSGDRGRDSLSSKHLTSSLLKYLTYNATELADKALGIMSKHMWLHVKPAMTSNERLTVHLLLKEFVKICDMFNITDYFLFSGTLLGSYRHHGLQPWDDDIDILMRYSDQGRILNAFRNYTNQSEEVTVVFMYTRLKLFHRNQSVAILPYPHRWPFLDMSFYHENETHIWEVYLDGVKKYHVVEKSLIFPLHHRPFEAVMINSPRDAYAVLKLLFRDAGCVPLTWVHRSEIFPTCNITHFECKEVAPIYPFVHRKAVDSCIEESLWVNDTLLYTLLIKEPTYAVTKPYLLELVTATTPLPNI